MKFLVDAQLPPGLAGWLIEYALRRLALTLRRLASTVIDYGKSSAEERITVNS